LDDYGLANSKSKHCKRQDLDSLFILIDNRSDQFWKNRRRELEEQMRRGGLRDEHGKPITVDAKMSAEKVQNKVKALSRVEFVAAIVYIAIFKYVLQGELQDVSEAVFRLLSRDIRPDPSVVLDPNVFRREHCYTAPLTNVLVSFEKSLREIFAGVAGGGRTGAGSDLICLGEWVDFLNAVDFIGPDLTKRRACFAFVWSRMCVVNPRTKQGYMREESLPFEGFMEALCRIAVLKALPTD